MPLKLVIGPANSAKAGAVLGTFRARLRRDPWLVVPTPEDVAHYERELMAEGARQGGRVVTFAGLMREIAARTGGGGRAIGPLQRERLVAGAIAAARPDALAAVADTRGFLRAAVSFVAELERSLITPQRLTAAVRAWSDAPPAVHEVAAIYDRYARELDRLGRVDGELFAWRALDALRARREARGDTPVLFYGFDDFTRIERDAIETLATVVDAEVVVSLSYEPGRAAFAARAGSAAELAQLAGSEVEELPPQDDWYDPAARTALHHLERGLFEPGAGRVDPGDAVSLLVAGGERAEVELVAATVLRLLREEEIAGEEIAVVLRNPGRSASLVEQVFGAYGIPHALDWSVPFEHTALGRGLLALARCSLTPEAATPADLLAYLRTPGRLTRLELADRLEYEVRRRAIATLEDARAAWEQAPGGWPLRELDRLRGAAADSPAALLAALGREARTLFAAPHRGRAHVLDAAEEADARALAVLLRALAELTELADAAPRRGDALGLLDAASLLVSLGELDVVLGEPARPGAVLVADPLAIRARRFDTVVVCGLQEGELPRAAVPEPFLTDDQRRALNTAAGLGLELREDALADERYLFYAIASRPRRRLVLSCRDADEDGNPALPSFFVADVAALLTELKPVHRPLAQLTWPADEAPTAAERARAEALAGPRATSRPIASLGPDAQAALRQRELLSAGALESYARCPVRWLVEGELQPARFEPDPEAMARGSCIHRVLERTLGRVSWPVAVADLPGAEEIVREVVAEEAPRFTLGRGAAAQAAAAHEIAADVLRLLSHEASAGGGFKPAELELRFGFGDDSEEGTVPPLSLGGGGGALRLRGVIDRVDLDAAGRALVRDYKSGRKNPSWPVAKWSVDDQLQVALYMVAVRELLGREPAGGVYQPLRGEDLRARGVIRDDVDAGDLVVETDRRPREELEAALNEAAQRACQLAARLRAGELVPSPETCGRDGCQYPGICRSVET
jgi:ATP-dependent helicase/DNAse subunit B